MKKFLVIPTFLFILCITVSGAHATLTATWNNKVDFLSDNTGLTMESFENVVFNPYPTEFITEDFTVTSDNSIYAGWDNISTSYGVTDGNQSIKL